MVNRLESVWTIPSIDSDTGNVVFPMGAYFTSVSSAQRFYNVVNLRPQTIFSANPALSVSPWALMITMTVFVPTANVQFA